MLTLRCAFSLFLFLTLGMVQGWGQIPLEIWEIQGSGNSSPYLGQAVATTDNIVTAVGDDFFFVQTPATRSDNSIATSDGLTVFTNGTPNVEVGDLVDVSGTVREIDRTTNISGFDVVYTTTDQDAPLPDPVVLTAGFPSPNAVTIPDLERVEGMRVSFTAAVVGPCGSSAIAALAIGDRPFREAGIRFPGPNDLPEWDGNPELFFFDPDALNQPDNRFLSFGEVVTATAVMAHWG
ncbi:MAG: hypothetical protein AAGA62_15460, partial [Bacteroidota bacterium]